MELTKYLREQSLIDKPPTCTFWLLGLSGLKANPDLGMDPCRRRYQRDINDLVKLKNPSLLTQIVTFLVTENVKSEICRTSFKQVRAQVSTVLAAI
jgi:hypothetical protein